MSMPVAMPPRALLEILLVGALLASAPPGCGPVDSNAPSMTGDANEISELIDELNESGPEASLFVDGKAPSGSELETFRKCSFSLTGTPRISGSPATVPILVYDETVGEELGQASWTFSKVGDAWKIESAPMP